MSASLIAATGLRKLYGSVAAVDGIEGDLTEAVRAGYERAAEAVDGGAAQQRLETWVSASRALAEDA